MNYEKPELLDLSSSIAMGDLCESGSVASGGGSYCSAGGQANGYCTNGSNADDIEGAYCTSSGSFASSGACTTSGQSAVGACSAGNIVKI